MKFRTYHKKQFRKHNKLIPIATSKTKLFSIFNKHFRKIIRYYNKDLLYGEEIGVIVCSVVTAAMRHEISSYEEIFNDEGFNRNTLNASISKNLPGNIGSQFIEWLKYRHYGLFKKYFIKGD